MSTKKYQITVAILLLTLVSGCAKNLVQEGHVSARKVPLSEIENIALYAMMSSNAYLDSERTYFPIEDLGWVRVDLNGNPTEENSYSPSWIGRIFSNLQFDIWEHQSTNQTVISFKGTDEKIDWLTNFWIGPSVQYKSAKKHVREYKKNNTDRTVITTGHSLGGGLALSSSLWLGVDAYAYNSSPRVFDGWKDNREQATRKAIYQENEVLSKLRSFWPKFNEVMNEADIYQTNFDYSGVSNHRADYLAEGLLRCAPVGSKLAKFAKELTPIKVKCNF